MSTTTTTTATMSTAKPQLDSAAALFELFDNSVDQMYNQSQSQSQMVGGEIAASQPRQILGESVFNQFIKSTEDGGIVHDEFLGLAKLEVPELSPSVGTVTPLQLHSSIVESVFSPSLVDSSPMFDDVELDSSNWDTLFEPNELEVKPFVKQESIKQHSIPEIQSPFLTSKRSASEADLYDSSDSSKRRSCSPFDHHDDDDQDDDDDGKDHLGVTAYNRKQRCQPLNEIVIDQSDPVAAKRARNTEAARRSRARKMERMNQLEDKVEALSSRNSELESEVMRLRALLAQHSN